jgi:hypothetical protein
MPLNCVQEDYMKLRGKFCKVIFCVMLAAASIGGASLRAEEVEELLHEMNQPKVAHTLPDDAETGDDPIGELLNHRRQTLQ